MWNLPEQQRALLNRVESNRKADRAFGALCASIQSELSKDLFSETGRVITDLDLELGDSALTDGDIALLLALAWLACADDALALNDRLIEPACFDTDGLPVFVGVSDVFSIGVVCGFSPDRIREVFRAVRSRRISDAPLPTELSSALAAIGAARTGGHRPVTSRLSRTASRPVPTLKDFYEGEIARAKAGAINYSLFLNEAGRYVIERMKRSAARVDDPAGSPVPSIDYLAMFTVSMPPSPFSKREALRQFTAFLESERYTYQRLIYRALAA